MPVPTTSTKSREEFARRNRTCLLIAPALALVWVLPASEVAAIAAWAWRARLENRIFRGRDSGVSLHRLALDALRRWPNEADAIALFVLLQDMHGHTPGKRFALDFRAMKEAGLTGQSIPRLRAARRTLEAVGLVRLVGNHRAGSVHQTFTLARLRIAANEGGGIVHIGKPRSRGQT